MQSRFKIFHISLLTSVFSESVRVPLIAHAAFSPVRVETTPQASSVPSPERKAQLNYNSNQKAPQLQQSWLWDRCTSCSHLEGWLGACAKGYKQPCASPMCLHAPEAWAPQPSRGPGMAPSSSATPGRLCSSSRSSTAAVSILHAMQWHLSHQLSESPRFVITDTSHVTQSMPFFTK